MPNRINETPGICTSNVHVILIFHVVSWAQRRPMRNIGCMGKISYSWFLSKVLPRENSKMRHAARSVVFLECL